MMKATDVRSEVFHGNVKYSSTCTNFGCVKWRSGAVIFDKDDERGWHIRMKFDCSENSSLNLKLTKDTLRKFVCKDTVYFDIKKDKDYISLYLKPEDKRVVKHIEQLCREVLTKQMTGPINNSEVCITTSTPAKTGLFTQMGNPPSAVKPENSPTTFTSVKSHKKEPLDEDGKENLIRSYSKSNDQFLQRSTEKSRQCLGTLSSSFYGKSSTQPQPNNTPKWLGKRVAGMMPDPTVNKRPRLSDSISYSMKAKPAQPIEVNNQQHSGALEGFSNLGNTCYMNAILQSLFGLETFSSDLMANKKMLKSFHQQSLCCALIKLLYVKRQATISDSLRREALRRVKSAISTTAKRFSGYGQHDAHEFLGQVLDQLKEEVVKVSKATPTPNKENEGGAENKMEPPSASPCPGNNPITVNFEFEVLHTLTCLQCEEQVTKAEQFHDISLDVPKQKDLLTPRSLQDALSLFFKEEQIEYTCEKCGHGKSDVSHKITRLPRIFILHLKRYSYNQTFSKNTKMGQSVLVPTYITMKHHCSEETQPAFPPTLYETSQSNSKLNNVLDDSREDTPSRRKLEYPGYQFKSKSTSKEPDTKDKEGTLFTETKEKKDEVDAVLTLEDEDDPELSRAIEMSLKEHEEKDQMCRDFGEDSESNFERVLELSRQEHKPDVPEARNIHQMSEDEQIALAIQQSLMENDPYHHSNNTLSDDVIENADYMYTRNGNVVHKDDHSYTENYDIGPDGDNFDKFVKRTPQKTYTKRRVHSESEINGKSNFDSEKLENTKIKENLWKTTDSISGEMTCSNEQSDSAVKICVKDNAENSSNSVNSNKKNQNDATKEKNADSKDWRNRLSNLSSCFPSDDESVSNDLLCSEELPENFEFEADKTEVKTKCPGKVYEVHGSEESVEEKTDLKKGSEESDLNRTMSENKIEESKRADVNGDGQDSKGNDNWLNKLKPEKGLERDCQLTTKGGNKTGLPVTLGEDVFRFMEDDEDDNWLSHIDDKENKVPLLDTPKLSDPSEFSTDTNEPSTDEVDSYVEETVDIPEIKNEKGDLPYSYRLVSIVNHMGMSSLTGHYLSDVFDMKKKTWYSFDDTRVTKKTEDEVKSERQRSGYIFFYMSKEIFDDLALQHAVDLTSKKPT